MLWHELVKSIRGCSPSCPPCHRQNFKVISTQKLTRPFPIWLIRNGKNGKNDWILAINQRQYTMQVPPPLPSPCPNSPMEESWRMWAVFKEANTSRAMRWSPSATSVVELLRLESWPMAMYEFQSWDFSILRCGGWLSTAEVVHRRRSPTRCRRDASCLGPQSDPYSKGINIPTFPCFQFPPI